MLKVYGMADSGNCYKPCLLLEHLGRPYDWVPVDVLVGESRSETFLRMNPVGKVPVLEIEPGRYLPESNAILYYLADGSSYLPAQVLDRAQVLRWLFFEQYSHEPYIATSRFWIHILGQPDKHRAQIEERRPGGLAALTVMERHLAERRFFVGESMTIADISLYAYTHVAGEGGFDLGGYPAVRDWLDRIAAHPKHAPMRRIERR